MGLLSFEINTISPSTFHFAGISSFPSYAIPISPIPLSTNVLNTRVSIKFHPFYSPNLKFVPPLTASSLNDASNVGLISDVVNPKDLEFKPSFDVYLKAMESRTSRKKKRASTTDTTSQKQNVRGRGEEADQKVDRVGEKIDGKEGFAAAKEDGKIIVIYKEEGSSTSDDSVRQRKTKEFKNEHGRKESQIDVKGKQKHEANVREGVWSKHKSHNSLEPESGGKSGSGSGRISNSITRPNSNYSLGEKVVSSRQRDYNTQGKGSGGNKTVVRNEVMDTGFGRRNTEIESVVSRSSPENVKLNRNSKRFVDRGYDSDNVERAAFTNLEDISRLQFSHKELEERIQKLARLLNGADIDLPEWLFSKAMRSAKIKFNDYSITRVIILLGNLGNWKRVIQVIEWLQRRERFKSNKLRHIYTAALDALRKSRRPVEALNMFNAMQQQMATYPDLVAYRSIAVTLGQAGHMKELFDVIDIMRSPPKKKFKTGPFEKWDPRLEPDSVVYDAVLNACVKGKQWEGAFWVLQQLKKEGQQPSATTYGLVMEVMFSCGKYNLVHEFFRKLQKSYIPNSLTYRVLVNTLWKEGKTDQAVLTVQEMENRGIVGSASIYYDLARCLCAAGRSHEALMQIDKICKVANKPLVVTYTGLMQACLDSGNIQEGAFIFEKMKEICAPNLVTFNILLKAYLDHGMFQEAKELFEKMLENTNLRRGNADYKMLVTPDIYTFNTMLDACVAEKRWDYFDDIYLRMFRHGYHFNAKRHLRMVLEASRAGKIGPLEITWKYLANTGRIPPSALVKEMLCLKLEKDDYVSALTCITNNSPKDLQPFSKSSWLNLFKDNSQRFQKDRLVRLMNEASNVVSNSSTANPILVYLMESCKEFLCANDLSVADKDSVGTVFAVENKLVACSR
ncbi:hypothetical protein Lal_00028819 [Lupinus albus]|uniref:Putative tetratricopeptide-like helical domain-containing protein n=1 Tax=Lupinus albus TaxID=3870 RepID=A0A6A5NQ37_LUPAL|nr:putative tetratricopeptide-like helical domain-containing protein [Lupinus albus]KAF1884930.1 hypothetical protein Lal_00028819 [Lupinus albus]